MIASALMFASTPLAAQTPVDQPPVASARAQGVLRLKSANDFNTTVERIKADVAAKGVMLFNVIDQQALGEKAGIKLRRSTLILFGNPPLGTQFLTANPVAGLDWPVRMLVSEDVDGAVWISWNDFGWIAKRYSITNRTAQFEMAKMVSGSVAKAGATR
ncbi:MAG: DUF302 domain-containing protein [Sphingomonas sp.]|nr:chromosome condensation protein CrcB [Zymomonas sp.]MBA4040411.1 chromosome condensation protein CrcB [Sphingobium sp.]MBA4773657.1 DUF302 domain-containing protein [Sphingomonas sp.]PZP20149.1 MAG: chromosome condensation protein CrcB [Sphingomonas hengshuiensis]